MVEMLKFVLSALGQCKPFFMEYYPMCIGFCVIATVPCIFKRMVGKR